MPLQYTVTKDVILTEALRELKLKVSFKICRGCRSFYYELLDDYIIDIVDEGKSESVAINHVIMKIHNRVRKETQADRKVIQQVFSFAYSKLKQNNLLHI